MEMCGTIACFGDFEPSRRNYANDHSGHKCLFVRRVQYLDALRRDSLIAGRKKNLRPIGRGAGGKPEGPEHSAALESGVWIGINSRL